MINLSALDVFVFLTYNFGSLILIWLGGIIWGVLLPHVVRSILYKLLYWDYEIGIQIVSMWQIKPVMNGEIHVYQVVSYELCNHTILRPFKGDEFLHNEYCDGIHYGNPTSLITLRRNELKLFWKQLSSCVYCIVHR